MQLDRTIGSGGIAGVGISVVSVCKHAIGCAACGEGENHKTIVQKDLQVNATAEG